MGPIYRCEKGFGLAETMVAAVILLLVALAAATVFYQGAVSTVNTKHATEAIHRIHEELESLRAIAMNPAQGRSWIVTNRMPGYIDRTVTIGNNIPGTMTVRITFVDDAFDSLSTHTPPDPDPNDYLAVVVDIDWKENNQARMRRAGTIIR